MAEFLSRLSAWSRTAQQSRGAQPTEVCPDTTRVAAGTLGPCSASSAEEAASTLSSSQILHNAGTRMIS